MLKQRHLTLHLARDQEKAIQQRFSALKISGNLWSDVVQMRKGVHIETTEMARRRLLMNYDWQVPPSQVIMT